MLLDQNDNSLETRDQYQWQLQSEQITQVLNRSGLQTNGITGAYDERAFRFDIRSHIENSAAKLRDVAREVISALGVDDINMRRIGDNLQLRIPRSPEVAVPLLDLLAYAGDSPRGTAALGLAEDNVPILFNFASAETPHLLVTGAPNAGKTSMLRTIAVSLAITSRQSDVQLAVICPSASDPDSHRTQVSAWAPVNYLPHMLCDITSRYTEISELLAFFCREIGYRESNDFRLPRIVVVVDQVDKVLSRGGRECAEAIMLIAQRGPDAGIHLALGSQDASSNILSPQLLASLSVRLVGRSVPEESKRVVPGEIEHDFGALLGEGDFIALQHGRAVRLQGAYISDYDLHLCLSRIYQPRGILLAEPLSTRLRLPQTSTHASSPMQGDARREEVLVGV